MQPIQHPLCNDVLLKPPGMTEDECRDLHIRRDDSAVWSFWQPNPEELLALNRGGAVALIVMGTTHPPLFIIATHPTEPQESRPVDESEYRHRMEVVNGRLNKLLALSKQIVASWISTTEDSPKRRNLSDKFLDLINANRHDGSLVQPVHVEDEPGVTQADVERYRADAEGWKAEHQHLKNAMKEVSTALGDEWNTMPWPEAITAIKNRLAMAEAARDTERELHHAAKQNLKNLLHYVEGLPGHVPVSGNAVAIRDEILKLRAANHDLTSNGSGWKSALREKVQHLDDDRHWLDFNVEFTGWHNSTPEFFYRSGFNAAANAVLAMPEINPKPSES